MSVYIHRSLAAKDARFCKMPKNKLTLEVVGSRNVSAELPDLAEIYSIAYKILTELPEKYQPFIKTLLVKVENFADTETLNNLNLQDRYDLLGLYRGIPLPQKVTITPSNLPDIIYLFRCPLIRYARENDEPISELVNHVMIHEIGHHFGFSDDEMNNFETNS